MKYHENKKIADLYVRQIINEEFDDVEGDNNNHNLPKENEEDSDVLEKFARNFVNGNTTDAFNDLKNIVSQGKSSELLEFLNANDATDAKDFIIRNLDKL